MIGEFAKKFYLFRYYDRHKQQERRVGSEDVVGVFDGVECGTTDCVYTQAHVVTSKELCIAEH